jgi:hypothetical protein
MIEAPLPLARLRGARAGLAPPPADRQSRDIERDRLRLLHHDVVALFCFGAVAERRRWPRAEDAENG